MISLQAFLFNPEIAAAFEMKSVALYERQRALVRAGLLPQPKSRGRNSGGAMATPDTVAMIMLSLLVTDSLSEVDERVASWVELRAIEEKFPGPRIGKCHLTGQKTLHKALAHCLSPDSPAEHYYGVEVNRKAMIADIIDPSGKFVRSRFGRAIESSGIQIKAVFNGMFNLAQLLEIHSNVGTE